MFLQNPEPSSPHSTDRRRLTRTPLPQSISSFPPLRLSLLPQRPYLSLRVPLTFQERQKTYGKSDQPKQYVSLFTDRLARATYPAPLYSPTSTIFLAPSTAPPFSPSLRRLHLRAARLRKSSSASPKTSLGPTFSTKDLTSRPYTSYDLAANRPDATHSTGPSYPVPSTPFRYPAYTPSRTFNPPVPVFPLPSAISSARSQVPRLLAPCPYASE